MIMTFHFFQEVRDDERAHDDENDGDKSESEVHGGVPLFEFVFGKERERGKRESLKRISSSSGVW